MVKLVSYCGNILSDRPRKANLAHGMFHNLTQIDLEKINFEIENMHDYLKRLIDKQKLKDYVEILMETKQGNRKRDERAKTIGELDFIITTLIVFFISNRWLTEKKQVLNL